MRAVNKKVKTQHGRPLTYDFLKNSVEELGFKVGSPCLHTVSAAQPTNGKPTASRRPAVDEGLLSTLRMRMLRCDRAVHSLHLQTLSRQTCVAFPASDRVVRSITTHTAIKERL